MDKDLKAKKLEQLDLLLEGSTRGLDRRRSVPDQYVGKIHFEIITDPVITPSGVTFDRIEIMEHLQKVGNFDPFTMQKLTVADLIPNLALKDSIDEFLFENGWAVDY